MDSNAASTDYKNILKNLQEEKQKQEDEFNTQRARMRELFIQKESELMKVSREKEDIMSELYRTQCELNDVKSQLVVADLTLGDNIQYEKRKANDEIASLQQLVNETYHQSTSSKYFYDEELKKLNDYVRQLEGEIATLRRKSFDIKDFQKITTSNNASTVVMNIFDKGLTRTFGSVDSIRELQQSSELDSETSTYKKSHADEDVEILRSLIGPLEDQIYALKEKLRKADEQMQRCNTCALNPQTNDNSHISTDVVSGKNLNNLNDACANMSCQTNLCNCSLLENIKRTNCTSISANVSKESYDVCEQVAVYTCDMCSNYEAQLVTEQQKTKELQENVNLANQSIESYRKDLLKEVVLRNEMEERWNEKKEIYKKQVIHLTEKINHTENKVKEVRHLYEQIKIEFHNNLSHLRKSRVHLSFQLQQLQKRNNLILNANTKQMHSEGHITDSNEGMREIIVKHQKDIEIARIAKECTEDHITFLRSEIQLISDEMLNMQYERLTAEHQLTLELQKLRKELEECQSENNTLLKDQENVMMLEHRNLDPLDKAQDQVNTVKTFKINDCQNYQIALQQNLNVGPVDREDCTDLSDTLLVQFKNDWKCDQHEEDADHCSKCSLSLANIREVINPNKGITGNTTGNDM